MGASAASGGLLHLPRRRGSPRILRPHVSRRVSPRHVGWRAAPTTPGGDDAADLMAGSPPHATGHQARSGGALKAVRWRLSAGGAPRLTRRPSAPKLNGRLTPGKRLPDICESSPNGARRMAVRVLIGAGRRRLNT